jgi:hypothetical protein
VSNAVRIITSRDIDIRAANARLVEYTKLKDEIANRTTLQNTIVALNVAAVGTIGGFVVGKQANPMILLLLVPLSTALGLLWLDHARAIARIGDYLRRYLWPRLVEWERISGVPDSYEDVNVVVSLIERSAYVVPFFVIFIGPSVAASAISVNSIEGAAWWPIWGLDVAVAVFSLTMWLYFLRSPAVAQVSLPDAA